MYHIVKGGRGRCTQILTLKKRTAENVFSINHKLMLRLETEK